MATICKDKPVHSGFSLDVKIIITGIDVVWGDFIDFTLWCFLLQVVDFTGIKVQQIAFSIEWRLVPPHDSASFLMYSAVGW